MNATHDHLVALAARAEVIAEVLSAAAEQEAVDRMKALSRAGAQSHELFVMCWEALEGGKGEEKALADPGSGLGGEDCAQGRPDR